jgi:hypothetical protein
MQLGRDSFSHLLKCCLVQTYCSGIGHDDLITMMTDGVAAESKDALTIRAVRSYFTSE